MNREVISAPLFFRLRATSIRDSSHFILWKIDQDQNILFFLLAYRFRLPFLFSWKISFFFCSFLGEFQVASLATYNYKIYQSGFAHITYILIRAMSFLECLDTKALRVNSLFLSSLIDNRYKILLNSLFCLCFKLTLCNRCQDYCKCL